MKKNNIGFEYNLKNDNKEWYNVIKIAFDKSLDDNVRHQVFTLLRIRNIVQDGIDTNGIFSGIKWDKILIKLLNLHHKLKTQALELTIY